MNARELVESQGRKPVLGWAQEREIDLKKTDVRETWRKVTGWRPPRIKVTKLRRAA
jgi:hypothetical protein